MAGTYYATTTQETQTTVFNFTVQNTDPLVSLAAKSEGKIIDVVNDFSWTASPKLQSSTKVPVMYLQEREQIQNSLLSSAIYYLNAAAEFDIGNKDGNTAKGFNDNVKAFLTSLDDIVKDGLGTSLGVTDFLFRRAGVEEITKQNLASDTSLLQDRLKSYIGIYLTKPTGFNYVFPFYNQTPLGINSNWSSESQLLTNPVAGAVNAAQGAMERTAYMLNITQPGTFIEKPKFFQYDTAGDTVTVSFPLFNTIKRTDKIPYQQNYELLWILAFQNKPYRTSFSRISPPKLYTLTVPGQKYMPYCYISDMKIDFGGTRRNLPVSIPAPGTDANFNTVQISIPDVYMVSITFTSLLADVANRMVDSGFTSKKISVGTVSRLSPAAPIPAAPAIDRFAIDRFATVQSVSNKSIVKNYNEMVNDVLGNDAAAKASSPRSELNLALTRTDRLQPIPANTQSVAPTPKLPPPPTPSQSVDLNDLFSRVRPNPPSN
jgi:hypothetical protein